jgi:MFS transporter, PAT family, beta-lactamase induction signal transducer AmpG
MKSSSFLEIVRSPKMLALLIFGFASGLPAQALEGPLQLWLKEKQVDPLQITAIGGMATFPYAWKFIWAPLLDRFTPSFLSKLGRRQSWLLLTQAILIVLLLLMAAQNPSPDNLGVLTVIAVAIGFFSASQDIASDAYRTDVLDKRETGTGVALWTNGFRIAVLIGGNLIIGLADEKKVGHWSWPQIYMLMAGLLSLGAFASLWAPKPEQEDPNIAPTSLKDAVVLPFKDFIKRKEKVGGAVILAFILTYKLGDYMVKSVAKIFLKDIGFTATDIGNTGSIGIIAAIVGAIVGGFIILKIGMNRSLWIAAIGLSIGILPYELLTQVNQPNINLLLLAVIGESFFAGLEAAVFVAFMTTLCNPRFSATQFALFSSFMLAGRSFIVGPMGGIYQTLGHQIFFWISILAAIPSLFLLIYVAPLNIKNVLKSGFLAKKKNNLHGAIDFFGHAIDLEPDNYIAHRERGFARAEIAKGISDLGFRRSQDTQSNKMNYYKDAIGYYQGAIDDCNRSIELRTTTDDLDREIITIQENAVENLDRAIKLVDPSPDLDNKNLVDPSLNLDKENAGLYYNDRALIKMNLGNFKSAISDSNRAIELDNKNPEFYMMRGTIRDRIADNQGAIADLKNAIKLDPKNTEFISMLDRLQSKS